MIVCDLLQTSFLIKQYEKHSWYTDGTVSNLVALGLVASALACLCSGIIMEKIGVKKVAYFSCVIYSFTSLFALSTAVTFSIFSRIIGAFVGVLLLTSMEAIIYASNECQGTFVCFLHLIIATGGNDVDLSKAFCKSRAIDVFAVVLIGKHHQISNHIDLMNSCCIKRHSKLVGQSISFCSCRNHLFLY